MRETLESFCRREGLEELLDQWDGARNAPLTPGQVSYGSQRKVWWVCARGHRWQAAVYTRSGSGTGCPVCAGKRAQAGVNDLATLYPDLARQWHPVKNGGLTPDQVLPGSHRMVWWVCGEGHAWQARVNSRVTGTGCPVCANREVVPGRNDLAALYPDLARQWHPVKNGALTPDQVVPGSRRRVWWRCGRGHEWEALVSSRALGGAGCPVCSGRAVLPGENDLASAYPALAAQWHPTRNGALTPEQVTPASNRKVWWLCGRGHAYQATVSARTIRGGGCLYCAGRRVLPGFNDLATLCPDIARQWHPTLNGSLTPEMVTAGSRRKAWWLCPQGHVWKAVIYSRTGSRKSGCPVCAGKVRAGGPERYRALLAEQRQLAASAALIYNDHKREV